MNCDPAYLASIVDPTELANAALACGGGGGSVGPVPADNGSMQTSFLGDAYSAIRDGADSVVHTAGSVLSGLTSAIGKDLGNLFSGKVVIILLLIVAVAVIVHKEI